MNITVLLPVYNAGPYLSEAIDSILAQTDHDFELLIINDASTDHSTAVLQRYNDPRIRLMNNPKNLGLIGTLNLGLQAAKGKYIARMDQDDIAAPERLRLQSQYLDQHPDCAVVGSTITLINPQGQVIGDWSDDKHYTAALAIRQYLPKANCLAHPTVMGRTALFKTYRYNQYQTNAEDYDLWLRLTADHHQIAKLDAPLLRYRVHNDSMTQRFGLPAGQWLTIVTKGRFVWQALRHGKVNGFVVRVAWHYSKDLVWWLLYGRRNQPDILS